MDNQFLVFAPCALGLEELLADEMLSHGGVDVAHGPALVTARGDLAMAYRLCLWSRLASRLLLRLADWPLLEAQSLYGAMLSFPFEEHLDVSQTFAFNVTLAGGVKGQNSQYLARLAKDGLVDRFRQNHGIRPVVDIEHPALCFHLHWDGSKAILSLDLAGALHRRGYRLAANEAPIKENLAAAVALLAGFAADRLPRVALDPCCGSGTILIEAAMIAGDVAPGLSRSFYGFTAWKKHRADIWQELVAEAICRKAANEQKEWPLFFGFDADENAVAAARKNIAQAGLSARIIIEQRELAHLENSCPEQKNGLLLSNLPYGERLGEEAIISHLYHAFGRIAQSRFPGWRLAVLIAKAELTDSFAISWRDKWSLHNGAISCRLLAGTVTQPVSPFRWRISQWDDDNQFARRLWKNLVKMLNWAEKQNVFCFRVYDRDLPDYNFSVDLYEKWVLINEYAPPAHIDATQAEERFSLAKRIIGKTLSLHSDRLFIRKRRRQKGKAQYQRKSELDRHAKYREVREGNCRLLVNLSDYLDTGLFLDHRPLRLRIAGKAKDQRFLNLFAYSGAATAQAALGGAAATTSVDLSEKYLTWARMNLAANGLALAKHRFIAADCRAWLQKDTGFYDLIFLDPPTFANTQKKGLLFDIQRGHRELLELAMRRLASDGVLFFSTNFRQFVLDENLPERFAMQEITRETIPFDFTRNPKIHRVWEARHKQSE